MRSPVWRRVPREGGKQSTLQRPTRRLHIVAPAKAGTGHTTASAVVDAAFARMTELPQLRCARSKPGRRHVPALFARAPGVPQSAQRQEGRAMDARTSRYHEVYARWQRDPEGFWAEAAAGDRLVREAEEGLRQGRRHLRPLVRRRRLQHLLQRARPPRAAGRGDQAALIYDSPVTNTAKTFTYGRMLAEVQLLGAMLHDFGVEQGRPRHPLHADGAGGGDRHAAPARASARSIRWCSAASRAKELATRIDDAKPKLILSASAAASRARASCRTSRCSTRRSSSPSTSRRPA